MTDDGAATGGAGDEEMSAFIDGIWQRLRPVAMERVAQLEAAAAAAVAGTLAEADRAAAESTAHKLAGSLGLYGFDEGSRVARGIERRLAELPGNPDCAEVLPHLATDLRRALEQRG